MTAQVTDNIYQFSADSIEGQTVSLADFKDQVLLIVNTASQCGFTPQYQGLQSLYDKFSAQGFSVLGFPCNQFGQQEPGQATDIQSFCQTRYGVTFPLFTKVDVNGDNAHPLFKFLRQASPGMAIPFLGSADAIKWNFTKFLVDRQGQVVKRYGSMTKPEEIESDIQILL